MSTNLSTATSSAIAIIGMSGRFPGARNVEEFWKVLHDGTEAITCFDETELEASGMGPSIRGAGYVKARAILSDIEMFDADFFGFTPREAELTDPQQRLFLECAWEALEDAGYDARRFEGAIGVFGGSGFNHYLYSNLISNRALIESIGVLQASIRNRTDHLTTSVAYKMDLRGPAVTVQTACSTSLVASHLAIQSLLNYECDLALAGGAAIYLPQRSGYMYQEGGILSPDGHCRAFDERAAGTVSGNGVGVVVLKRLSDALQDRDHIEAVILGSAMGNDGAVKVGYTAPSSDGQAQVIAEAQAIAGIHPDTISYIEAHGTGTKMGDPIEVAALTQVFREKTARKGFCGLGSVKSNIGHLDAAAGIAGLVKTVLSLKHRLVPASLHFDRPNPELGLGDSPFFVNSTLRAWESPAPRRAGVSSFGIGGTNVHLVVEEAPIVPSGPESRPCQLLLLSAGSANALEATTANLASFLEKHREDTLLADVAYTLQTGRRELSHRRMVVCRDVDHAIATLRSLDPRLAITGFHEPKERPVVFMFPGQGAQYLNMAKGLYQSEPIVKTEVDECSDILLAQLGIDLRALLYPDDGDATPENQAKLTQTQIAQPALFVVEYAMARLLMSWGLEPEAMIGHSIGEYVAACLAEVFSREDALSLVAQRGRLMQQLRPGAMLMIPQSEDQVRTLLFSGLSLAAVNGPASCVVSGPDESIERLKMQCENNSIACRGLSTSHAFHSHMMDPILEDFRRICMQVQFRPPKLPYLSNLSGTWINQEEATNPDYWVRHLRETVRFGDGVRELVRDANRVLLEVGPGRTTSTLARWNPYRASGQVVLNSIRHPEDRLDDATFLMNAVGKLWLAGVRIAWSGFYSKEQRKRVALPTYPFQRERYWIESRKSSGDEVTGQTSEEKRPDTTQWFYAPVWKSKPIHQPISALEANVSVLVFCDSYGFGSAVASALGENGAQVFTVSEGDEFSYNGQSFTIRRDSPENYQSMFQSLHAATALPSKILYFWTMAPLETSRETFEAQLDRSFFGPLLIGKALGSLVFTPAFELTFFSNHLYDVTGNALTHPERATLLGPCRTLPQEYPEISCRHIDLDVPPDDTWALSTLDQIMAEISSPSGDATVAYRNGRRWVQDFEQLSIALRNDPPPLRTHGTYLVVGGLGGLGLVFAEQLAETANANLVLIGRSSFPDAEEWEKWLSTHDESDPVSTTIRKLRNLEDKGATILALSADVSDRGRMQEVIRMVRERFGSLHGVIHAAGVPGGGIIQGKTRQAAEEVLAPKVKGTIVLASVLEDQSLDFFVACSSRSSILGTFGQVDYCAANAFLNVFAHHSKMSGRNPILSVCWDAWQDVGMLVKKAAQAGVRGVESDTGTPFDHPLLNARFRQSSNREMFETTLSPLTHWILDEHRIVGNAVVPGVAYLEMARAAVQQQMNGSAIEIRDAFFLAPLTLRDDERREIRLLVEKDRENRNFRVLSRTDRPDGQHEWQEYANGHIAFVPRSTPRQYDIAAIAARCNVRRVILTDDSKRDEDLGPRWQTLKHAWIGETELLAFLELPDQFSSELNALELYPALLDRATGTGKEFLVGEGVYLPMGYHRLRIHAPLQSKIYAYIRFRKEEDIRRQTITFDVELLDEQGGELVEIEGFAQKRVNDVTTQIKAFASPHSRRTGDAQSPSPEPAELGALALAYKAELKHGITPQEGKEVFRQLLSLQGQSQIVISTRDLSTAIRNNASRTQFATIDSLVQATPEQVMHQRPNIETPFAGATDSFQKSIAEVWQNVLGIEEIGVHDNFFDLGGDSVQAIQIIAQLNQRGLHLTPQQLFQNQTISELAAIAETSGVAIDEGDLIGEVDITPIQSELFTRIERNSPVTAQAILLDMPVKVDVALLQQAFDVLLRHHDILRVRFTHNSSGWRQEIPSVDHLRAISSVDLSGIPEDDRSSKVKEVTADLISSMQPDSESLFRGVLFDFGPALAGRLLIAAHPLIADRPSLQLLVDDLESSYTQLANNQEVRLSPKTATYRSWSRTLKERWGTAQIEEQADYWLSEARLGALPLPVDSTRETVSHRAFVTRILSMEATQNLLEAAPATTRASIDEILLASLASTLSTRTVSGSVLIDVEDAGRSDVISAVNLTRTIGAFAQSIPVLLRIDGSDTSWEKLSAVKEQVRRARHQGATYGLHYLRQNPLYHSRIVNLPKPSVGFAYHGVLDEPLENARVFGIILDQRGTTKHSSSTWDHPMEVFAFIVNKQLHLQWNFDSAYFSPEGMENTADAFLNNLSSLMDSTHSKAVADFIPSDFPLAGLDDKGLADLDEALAAVDRSGYAANREQDRPGSKLTSAESDGNVRDSAVIAKLLQQHPRVSEAVVIGNPYDQEGATAYLTLRRYEAGTRQNTMKFGLFYFADSNSASNEDKYKLYLEGARFADVHGFNSVWTPERHFHEKGGLYPNPSVLSAALAVATSRIQLRAGSVVMPLHNPLRVAEEWSIVDNLSGGRAGISFVSGWVPNDFAFFPERYANKREEMFRGISEVQRLWRGEKITTRDGAGKLADIGIFPKPIQPELPIWLTCSGSPDMFVRAGELGFHVLTSLQTQSIDEVAPKLASYREARSRAGYDPATGQVAMMMHTFLSQSRQHAIETVREPLINYLRSHLDLIKTLTNSLNIDAGLEKDDTVDSIAQFAFERYCRTASLIGTPQTCLAMVNRLQAIGVSEIACLIDFGVNYESTLGGLDHLVTLQNLCNTGSTSETTDIESDVTSFVR